MKAFQCSQCAHLEMDDDKVLCCCPANPIPKYRDKGDRELCLESFEPLPPEKQWHKKFYWEK